MKYTLNLTTWASTSMDFETDLTDPEEIAAAFFESCPNTPTLCHQCAGSSDQNLDIGDEWEIDRFEGRLLITPAEGTD